MASEISVYCAMEPFQGNPDGGAAEDWVCAAMLQEVAAAHPEARVHMARAIDDADVVLDTRVGPGFVARVVWQGQPAGNWTGTALRGREIGAQEVAVLIRTLLQTNPKP